MIERLVLLRTIDSLWVEHLTELDDMRRGIGLRGYAQQDPLNEFRREAFALYTELRDLIRHQLANTIFRVTVTRQPPPPPSPMPMPDAATLAACATARRRRRRERRRARSATAPGRRRPAARGAAVRGRSPAACRAGPSVRGVRESLGDEVVGGGAAAERRARRPPPRLHADRRADRPQRRVLLRLGAEVQAVSRPVTEGSLDRRAR